MAKTSCEESGEANPQRRRHAEHVRAVFDRANAEWDQRPTADWLRTYERELGNLRAALDWAFSKEGDGAAGRRSNCRCGTDLVSSLAARRRPVACRACDHLAQGPADPGSPPDDAALCNFRLAPDARDQGHFQWGGGLAGNPGAGHRTRRCRLPAPRDLGALGRPRQQWRGGGGSRPRRPLCRPRGARWGFTGSDDRAADAREILALLGRFRRITPTDRADAGALRATAATVARHPFPIRPTTDRPDHPGSRAVASRLRRSSVGFGRADDRRRPRPRAHPDTGAHSLGCGVLHSVVGWRPAARRTVHEDVAGTHHVACARRLAHLRRRFRRRNSNSTATMRGTASCHCNGRSDRSRRPGSCSTTRPSKGFWQRA